MGREGASHQLQVHRQPAVPRPAKPPSQGDQERQAPEVSVAAASAGVLPSRVCESGNSTGQQRHRKQAKPLRGAPELSFRSLLLKCIGLCLLNQGIA